MGIKFIPMGFDSHGDKKRFPRDSIPMGIKDIPMGIKSHGNKIYSQGI